ncbi:uncharacterized protein F4807DRAFT_50092 [Annulohypoxylon truncatum]|uniref:uncharacterized protein n=1 Tax=Annulohypoxylon truncatum TaxID=327061 RepID=UPI00200870F6|nr:uncharacterized protein F4807DRAFT_50092 [Annulohypoxylon truncatum]KAI1211093.1 hypothetical protein F4807DRAFT_50092 [Annulohypoxylon truncatum]
MASMALAQRPRSGSAGGIWEQNESTIRQLYETERKTLKEVKQIMESEHGFPITPLSTYETKLRDRLKLRKKLKKTDWIAVHHHYLARDGKDTGIYLNGRRIPWKNAWKEIRRSGARSTGTDRHTRLPTGVVVRTPSPAVEDLALQPLPVYEAQAPVHSRLSVSPSTDLVALQPSRTHIYGSVDTTQLSWGYQSRCTSIHDSDFEARVANSLQLSLQENVVALRNIPWVSFKNEVLSIVCKLGFDPTRNFMDGLLGEDSSVLWRFTTISPMFSFLRDLDPAPASSVSTWNINVYYLLAEAIYLVSNDLLDHRCDRRRNNEPCPEIIQLLLKRVPKTILLGLFQSDLPTIRSLWDVLAYHAGIHGYKDVFVLLMEVGLRHSGWILPEGYFYLASAVSMGALDLVRRLLKVGIRADYGIYNPMDDDDPLAIIHAIATGSMECLKLLLGACDVNRNVCTRPENAGWSNLQSLISVLTGNPSATFARRDHAYLPNSYRQTPKGMLILDFDLESESVSRAVDMILDSGANVDLTCDDESLSELYSFYYGYVSPIPIEWRPTILEYCYYQDVKLFIRLAPYSTQVIGHITRPGICHSAKQGKEMLREYLASKSTDSEFYKMAFLELVLAEQFFEENKSADVEVVRGLIEFGVDPKLASLRSGANHLLCLLIRQIRSHKDDCGEEFYDMLKLFLQSGLAIDSEILEAGVEEVGIDMLLILSHHASNVSKDGTEALLTAACFDNYEAVSWLLEAGVDPNAVIVIKPEPWSIIALASLSNYDFDCCRGRRENPASCEMLKYLIDCGAVLKNNPHDPNAFDFLHRLLSRSEHPPLSPEKVKLFLDTIMDQHDLSKPGACLLEASLRMHPSDFGRSNIDGDGRIKIRLANFEQLLKRGVPARDSHVLALLILCKGRDELTQEVLNAGADINAYSQLQDKYDLRYTLSITPIQAAASTGNRFLADQLIRMGANVNQPGLGLCARTALQAACGWRPKPPHRKRDKLDMIQLLIENGADVNAPAAPGYGMTALQAAASEGDIEAALLLIHFGADPNALPDRKFRMSALDQAAYRGRLDMVQLLLNVGALSWVRGRTGYRGAIWYAKVRKFFAIIDLIQEHVRSDFKVIGASLAMTFENDAGAASDEIWHPNCISKDEMAQIGRELDKIESGMIGNGSWSREY